MSLRNRRRPTLVGGVQPKSRRSGICSYDAGFDVNCGGERDKRRRGQYGDMGELRQSRVVA